MDPAALLEGLVSIPSVSREEGPLADHLQRLLEAQGFQVRREGASLWFEVGAPGPRLLLVSHLDTVLPSAGWSADPFQPRWEDGRCHALGANDAKGCVAALVLAALALRERDLPGTAVFAFVAEEEVGGGGIRAVLPRLGRLDAAIVGEPTGLSIMAAQRGMLLLRLTAKGVSAHSAHAHLGENAIHKAARDIARLEAMSFPAHPLLGVTRPQVTQIKGGLARNQVPDVCEAFVDLRTTPNLDQKALAERIAAELESEVEVHSDRYLPVATPEGDPILKAALEASGRQAPEGSATASDWAFLSHLPAVKAGPGDTHRSHRPDEWISLAELEAGARFYREATLAWLREVTHG